MKKLTLFTCICIILFAVLLGIGAVSGNAWVSVSSLLPLLIGVITVFHRRHFK